MNAQQRADALQRLARCTREIVDDDIVALYIEKTAGFADDTFCRACSALENTATWFPKVAELRAACAEARPQEKPIDQPSAPQLSQERAEFWLAKIRKSAGIRKRKAVQP